VETNKEKNHAVRNEMKKKHDDKKYFLLCNPNTEDECNKNTLLRNYPNLIKGSKSSIPVE
jgi:hypothetical protein